MKNNYDLIFVISTGLFLVASWMFWISPMLIFNNLESYSDAYIGKMNIVDKIGDKITSFVPIYVTYDQKITPYNSTALKVSSTFVTYDALMDKKLWDSNRTNFIYKNNGKFLGYDNAYFRFPMNTQKQNYNAYIYASGDPQPFIFDKEEVINGLNVYKFNCKLTADLSSAYPQFQPTKIWSDYTCTAWIEPSTGDEISYQEHWLDYAIINGAKIPVSIGTSHTTEHSKNLAIEDVRNDQYLITLYDTVIPSLSLVILSIICILIVMYKKQKRKIVESKLQHEKDEKLTAIGLVASRLAHDIRNPLSVIKNAIALMEFENQNEKSQERFVMIDRAIARITHQIDDVMDFVRSKPLNISEINITSVIDKTLQLLQIPAGISINVESHDIKLECDPKQLEVVLNNLIINAIESLGEKGTIKIRVKEMGNMVYLSIEDSGPGVSLDIVDKIFEPLFTTKQTGTGLGLVSCKNIIEQHGGKIVVSNNPSTFTIILPKKYHEKKT